MRDAEIKQLDYARGRAHHVGRLDVTMHHAASMRVGQRVQHLAGIADGVVGQQRPVGQQLFYRDAVHKLHDHQELIGIAERRVELGDIRVVERSLQFDLAQKPLRQLRVSG